MSSFDCAAPRSTRGSVKVVAMIVLLLLGGGGLIFFAYRGASAQKKRATVMEQAKQGQIAKEMSEEERRAYVEKFVSVTELKLAQDTKPNSDEPVPGLFRVTGIVTNQGDQKLTKIELHVYPEDATGKVLGAYIQNIAGPTALLPGATRDFRFQVPQKKEYSGKFTHQVK